MDQTERDRAAHPTWCDPEHCTADLEAVRADRSASERGQHRSGPVRLGLPGAILLPSTTGTAFLSQAAAEWDCVIYVRLCLGEHQIAIPVKDAWMTLERLANLLVTESGAVVPGSRA